MLPCDDVDALLKDIGEFIAYFSMAARGAGAPAVDWTGGVGFTSGDVKLTLVTGDTVDEVWTEEGSDEIARSFSAFPLAGKCVWFDLLSGMLDEEDGYEHYQQWIHRPPSSDVGISNDKTGPNNKRVQQLYVKSAPYITYPIDPDDQDTNAEVAHIMAASYKEIWETVARKFTEEQLQAFGPLPKIIEHRHAGDEKAKKDKDKKEESEPLGHPDSAALMRDLGEFLGSMGAVLSAAQQRGGGSGFVRAGVGPVGTVVFNSPSIPELLRVHEKSLLLLRKVNNELLPGPAFSGFDVAGKYCLVHYGDRLRASLEQPSVLDGWYAKGQHPQTTVEESGPHAVRVADKKDPDRHAVVHPLEATLMSQLLHADYKELLDCLLDGLPEPKQGADPIVTPWGEV
ncbi:hypothetical protein [Segniliparus rugosus]|uniref:Uncharacterized protein n=1 Tax=Segniliparus rugosus (strain ATCC BAA-974 / DSM 45345 / CCUG 50838 / CIP 108380 / JCM 13579 / CDC 945) TaxID=679197 RepID=E5XQG5_SEGRC|nr:hypothetical protein [Segniliparus rugosus]EFV13406.2 hypothetical protein HMPREF9336_01737 [Segniliparus rugosus ATCC BAA-974]